MTEMVGQISEIRSRLAQLAQPTTNADSGASFASVLSAATTTDATASADATTAAGATTGTDATSATAAAGATGAVESGTGVTGDDVVQAALQYKGVPYVLGGESKSGIDCSGLVQTAFKDLGVSVPRLVHEQKLIGEKVDSLKDAKPGDLIVLNGGDHIAIWMGNDTVIHAPYPGRTVSVQKAWFTDADVTTIRRVVPATADATTTGGTVSPLSAATATATSTTAASTTGTSTTAASTAAASQAAALLAMYGTSSGTGSTSTGSTSDSMAALLASISGTASGSTASGSTAQQLLAARASLLATGA